MVKFSITFIFSFLFIVSFSQEITLKGIYGGSNLYIINPSYNEGYCVSAVYINDSLSKDEIQSNAFEVDFGLLKIDSGTSVKVKILHNKDCFPVIVNPDAISPQNKFSFKSFKINRTGAAVITTYGEQGPDPLIIEQFRWGKWVSVMKVSDPDTGKSNIYSADLKFHSGENQFRVCRTNESGSEIYSKIVKIRSQAEEITISSTKVTDVITFSGETAYEIFDELGVFIRDGYGSEADVSDLPKGKYWLNYDNKTTTFNKK